MTHSLNTLRLCLAALGLLVASCADPESATLDSGSTETSVDGDGLTSDVSPISDSEIPSHEVLTDDALEVWTPEVASPPSACQGAYDEPVAAFTLPGAQLLEISGLVASRQTPGALWAHNDSGAQAELLAFSEAGLLTRLTLQDIEAIDWEDLAMATCPKSNGDCLWVADMGNNLKNREVLSVIVVEEPAIGSAVEQTRAAQAIYTFSYPDDTMDAEALLVSPQGDRFYILEKTDGDTARVFSSPTPLTTDDTMTLVELTTMQSPGEPIPYGKMITGAELHPTGSRMAVRCYTGTWEFRFGEGQGIEHLGEITPTYVALGPLVEVQGEAVTYDAAGVDLFTASEDPNGLGEQPVHRYACQD